MLKLTSNDGRCFAVGDIHGCYDELLLALHHVGFNYSTDRLLAVGDLVDRSQRSSDCLRLTQESFFYSTLGNHEDMMLRSLNEDGTFRTSGNDLQMWFANGGDWIEQYFTQQRKQLRALASQLPYAIEYLRRDGQRVGLIHAGCPNNDWKQLRNGPDRWHHPSNGIEKQWHETALWERRYAPGHIKLQNEVPPVHNIDIVIVGHTPVYKPTWCENRLFLDVGAVYGNKFAIVDIDNLVIGQNPDFSPCGLNI